MDIHCAKKNAELIIANPNGNFKVSGSNLEVIKENNLLGRLVKWIWYSSITERVNSVVKETLDTLKDPILHDEPMDIKFTVLANPTIPGGSLIFKAADCTANLYQRLLTEIKHTQFGRLANPEPIGMPIFTPPKPEPSAPPFDLNWES